MIHLFTDPYLRELWNTGASARYPEMLARRVLAFLDVLDAASSIEELEKVPGCRTRPLFDRGAVDVKTMDISPNWKIVFHMEGGCFTGLRLQHAGQSGQPVLPPTLVAVPKMRKPTLPASILWHFFMEPMNLRQTDLADSLKLNRGRINAIMHSRFAVSADTANRLESAFGVSAQFWLRLQMNYDIWKAKIANDDNYRNIARVNSRVVAGYETTERGDIPSPQDVESNLPFDQVRPG